MSLRLILIHFIYRVVFGVGIAALMWVGGHFVYAKTYQLYAMPKLKNDPDITTGMSDIQSSHAPLRSRNLRHGLESPGREVPNMLREALNEKDENPSGIATGHFDGTLPGRLAGRQRTTPFRNGDGKFADAGHRMAFVRDLQPLRVGDTIQLSTPRGTFGYFVTTIEVIDPSEPRIFEYPDLSELTIVTTPPFPFVGAVPQQFVVRARPQNEVKN
jgi:LPXTG-site transpeptidase (sortase) family protein